MTVTKAVVRGILVAASVSTSTARAGSMLVLGVTASYPDAPPVAASPTPFYAPFAPAPAPTLRLGVTSNPSPLVFQPVQAQQPAAMPFAPAPAPQPVPMVGPAPVPQVISPPPILPSSPPVYSSPAPPSGTYDAFINMGSGPYASAANLTTGNPQAWYLSAPVDRLFGGIPGTQQQLSFENTVLQRVQQTFGLSGVPVSLTLDPNAPAAHMVSVVSQATNPNLTSAIGVTSLGGNGFHYIDNSASVAQSVDQLEWIVAHNVAHELMLAFHVPETHDTSGQFIDAQNASWSMITSPTATFSPGAVADLLSKNFLSAGGSVLQTGAQFIGPSPVPEPTSVVLWTLIVSAGLVAGRARRRMIASKA